MDDYGEEDIQLQHGIKLSAKLAWQYLFTHPFDVHYMNLTGLGDCEELASEIFPSEGKTIRKTKILPVVGETNAEKMFIGAVSSLFKLEKISYVTEQTKYHEPFNEVYKMEFVNSGYTPDVAGLKTKGRIEIQPYDKNPQFSVMITHIRIKVSSPLLRPFESLFKNAARDATHRVFTQMIARLPDYHNSVKNDSQ